MKLSTVTRLSPVGQIMKNLLTITRIGALEVMLIMKAK